MVKTCSTFASRSSSVPSTPKSVKDRSSPRSRSTLVFSYPRERGHQFIIIIHFLALLNSDMQLLHAGSLLPSHWCDHIVAGAVCDDISRRQLVALLLGTSKQARGHGCMLPSFLPLLKKMTSDIYGQLAHWFFIVSSIAVVHYFVLCFYFAFVAICCVLVRMISAFFFQPPFFSRPCMHHPFHEPCLLPVACDLATQPMKQRIHV